MGQRLGDDSMKQILEMQKSALIGLVLLIKRRLQSKMVLVSTNKMDMLVDDQWRENKSTANARIYGFHLY
ncbi:respiratory nitrate reductase subunit gamma [bacterium]|nr:respiratory nitrate reductase subunit gamma [bacterium]